MSALGFINKVQIQGIVNSVSIPDNPGRDYIVDFCVRTDYLIRDECGRTVRECDDHPAHNWKSACPNISLLKVGMRVKMEGELDTYTVWDKQGERHIAYRIIPSSIEILES